MKNKKLYILLSDTGSLLTKMIKLYTKKTYNHVSISLDGELKKVYSFGRKRMYNPFRGGFVQENTKSGLFKHASCAIYSVSVSEEQFERVERFIKRMELQQDKYHYNFIGLFGFLFNKPIERKNAFFCSQFVATVLKEGNVVDIKKQPGLISPGDIQECVELGLVYEGALRGYHRNEETERFGFSSFVAAEV